MYEWSLPSPKSKLLWLCGRPGCGKSILSSFLVHHLRDEGSSVQHFHFRGGDETKRSIGSLLRRLAFQIAVQFPAFRKALLKLAEGGCKVPDVDWKSTWKRIYVDILFRMELCTPVYWVIDALDESSAGQAVLELLVDIQRSRTPIHVLVTGRQNPVLSSAVKRISSRLECSILPVDCDLTDMRTYIDDELQYFAWEPPLKHDITHKILDQANHSFLWVHLVLEEIKECNTEESIRATLAELPSGMETLYQRMESAIMHFRRPADESLSRQLFLWALHAHRSISVEELQSILECEFGRMLDISTTLNRLCGHFIVIESNNRIGLLHQTAREYLTSTQNLPFSLEAADAHKELLHKSLSAFLEKGLRQMLSPTKIKLLEYRAIFWPSHLKNVDNLESPDDQLDILTRFFRESSFLTWVQTLAAMGQLSVLIETSHSLIYFTSQVRKADSYGEFLSRHSKDIEFLELWSRDLLKLPARFSGSLSLDPSSIQYSVAPLCPRHSAIYQTFGSNTSLSARGIPDDWDECLTRVSIGSEHSASLVRCSARYLLVTNSAGNLFVWDSGTFNLLHSLSHGSTISAVTFNASGDRIATYGAQRTIIWDPQSGVALLSIENSPEVNALFIAFANGDNTLMVGSDRRRVLYAHLNRIEVFWEIIDKSLLDDNESFEGTFQNVASTLSLSPDHSSIAAVYRKFPLTIWSVDPPRVLKRLNRGHASIASPFVQKVAWHPGSEELMGIFNDTCIFRLNIIDGTYEENRLFQEQWPFDIRVSPNGSTFAISGSQGSINIFDYQTWALIYQMTSEDIITDFCFSPDGYRLYDIRQSFCSVWEPSSLRLSTVMGPHSHRQTLDINSDRPKDAFECFVDNPMPVTLLSPRPGGPVVLMADEDGLIELLDYDNGYRAEIYQSPSTFSAEDLVWGEDGNHFAYLDIGGTLTVSHVKPISNEWRVNQVARFKVEPDPGDFMQLLLSPDSKSLLVVFHQSIQLWSVQESAELLVNRECHDTEIAGRWCTHPQSASHLLSITATDCVVHRWGDLAVISCWSISADGKQNHCSSANRPNRAQRDARITIQDVKSIITSHSKTHLIIRFDKRALLSQLQPNFLLVSSHIGLDGNNEHATLETASIPDSVRDQIKMPLNVLKNDRLVFLDKAFGICTWNLKSGLGGGEAKRHFFIPRDWASTQTIEHFHITQSGSFLCPLKKEIAVINSTIGSDW